MIVTILIWFYTLSLTYLFGWFACNSFVRISGIKNRVQPSGALVWIVGLCTLSTLVSFLSLFIKIGLVANLILLFLAVLILLFGIITRGNHVLPLIPALDIRKISLAGRILLLLTGLTVLIISVRVPSNPDTALYHAQAIHWVESYKAVPGLGNLHSRLAYSSNWMVLNALFSFAFLGKGSFHLLNSTLFLIALSYLFGGLNGLLQGDHRISNIVKSLLFPTAFLILGSEVSSPGTDLPVTLLSWVILTELVVLFEKRNANRND
ncbi:MAG: hypothetical protein MUO76_00100, partial [Anaerolineaceae bacterium]|nr:hypothetical protein [Anaerolineaceae bacterium]